MLSEGSISFSLEQGGDRSLDPTPHALDEQSGAWLIAMAQSCIWVIALFTAPRAAKRKI